MLAILTLVSFLRAGAERMVPRVCYRCSKSSRRSLFSPRCMRRWARGVTHFRYRHPFSRYSPMVSGGFLSNLPSSRFGRHSINLVEGATVTFFFKVADTGPRLETSRPTSPTRTVCGSLGIGGEIDGWNVGGISCTSSVARWTDIFTTHAYVEYLQQAWGTLPLSRSFSLVVGRRVATSR